jgi:tetratricopeptide (TPR) repeat protein
MPLPKIRWLIAMAAIALGAWCMNAALKIPGFGAAGYLIVSFGALIFAVLLVSPETAFRVAEWCSRPFTDLLFPSDEFAKPLLSYVLARRYARELRLSDAVDEYEKIIRYYPDEKDAYLELIAVAQQLNDRKLLKSCLKRYRKRFKQAPPFRE